MSMSKEQKKAAIRGVVGGVVTIGAGAAAVATFVAASFVLAIIFLLVALAALVYTVMQGKEYHRIGVEEMNRKAGSNFQEVSPLNNYHSGGEVSYTNEKKEKYGFADADKNQNEMNSKGKKCTIMNSVRGIFIKQRREEYCTEEKESCEIFEKPPLRVDLEIDDLSNSTVGSLKEWIIKQLSSRLSLAFEFPPLTCQDIKLCKPSGHLDPNDPLLGADDDASINGLIFAQILRPDFHGDIHLNWKIVSGNH